ncbi:hypothetical protein EXIGLDRAFT_516954 [Exidia glandulosa HHB12029]|uniref:WW domain-containing protein n=1 Tax=Exidia glandulosa HHB12029 TaxID=1314781 RepID=A0A165J7S8_EXIGL|nr:hypothetical protein EXIGLDRAFT_516954 [Exidia glandulosa HHB12029]
MSTASHDCASTAPGYPLSRTSTMCDAHEPAKSTGSLLAPSFSHDTFRVNPLLPDRLDLSSPNKLTNVISYPLPEDPSVYLDSVPDCVLGWSRFVHPGGRVYSYHHQQRTVVHGDAPVAPITGWADFAEDDYTSVVPGRVGLKAMRTIEQLWNRVPQSVNRSDCELFFRCSGIDADAEYYFVHWEKRAVFWVDAVDFVPFTSQPHQRDSLESMFWAHVDHFPMHHHLPSRSREELEKVLSYHIVDQTTYVKSTAPWGAVEAQLLCKSIRGDDNDGMHRSFSRPSSSRSDTLVSSGSAGEPGLKDAIVSGRSASPDNTASSLREADIVMAFSPEPLPLFPSREEGTTNAAVARIWRQICIARAINLYGDPHARLGRTDRRPTGAESDRSPPSWLQRILSALLFTRPAYFFGALQDVFVDEILYQRAWQEFVDNEVLPEWRDNGVVAAVVLATNMGFLALNGIEGANSPVAVGWKVLSLSSTLSSMGTILASMLLIQSYQSLKSATAGEANKYMVRCSQWPFGLFGMAMLFSMPFVMLMASLITFIVAVLGYSLEHWALTTALPLLLTTVIPIVFVLVLQTVFLGLGSCQRRRDRRARVQDIEADFGPVGPADAGRSTDTLTPSPSIISKDKIR